MMARTRTVFFWIVLATLGSVVMIGCGGSPEVNRARSALEQQDYESALSAVETALNQDSTNTDAYLLKAKILRERADSSMAPDEYTALHKRAWEAEENALSIDSGLQTSVEARRMRVYEREWDRGRLAYNQANKNQRTSLYRRAGTFFKTAATVQPDSARPLLNEAFSRLHLGDRAEVIPVLEAYVERADPPSKKAYKILGQLYLDTKSEKATDLLDQATRLHPRDQELQALRLNAYNQAGNADEALEAYRKQIKERPENAAYRYNYGALLLEAERYAAAIVQLDSAVALRPSHVRSQYNLGTAYVNAALARDDSIAAIEAQEISLPDTASRSARIGSLAQRRDHLLGKAIPPLERARKMSATGSPLQQDACRALMVAYVQTGRPNRAAQVESCTGFTTPDS